MKKLLSLILTLVMIMSVTPLTLAAECEHAFNAETADRYSWTYVCASCGETVDYELADYGKAYAVLSYDPGFNLYTSEEYAQQAYNDFAAATEDLIFAFPEGLSVYEQAELDAYTEKLEAEFRRFSEAVSSGKYGTVIDAALLIMIMAKYDAFVEAHDPLEDYFSPETLHKIKVIQREDFYYLTVIYQELSMGSSAFPEDKLTEFNARLENAGGMVNSLYDCTSGEHNFGDDLVCDFCGEVKAPEECEDCGRVHNESYDKYICLLISFIKLLVSFIKGNM